MSFFSELKRRNVFRVLAAYLVTAWLLIEVSSTLEQTLRLPDWADTLLAFFLILGFPVALFFSWAYEITPEGIKREKDLSDDYGSRPVTGRKLDRLIIVLMAAALVYFAVDKFFITQQTREQTAVERIAGGDASLQNVEPDLSIAVLPFVNMSSEPEQEYFSDGLTEELLNLLAGISELKVAARTSSFFYKDKLDSVPLTEIARQLEVAHVLEGSVRKSGDRVRITAQLISADDGFHLWSATWDRTLEDVFAIQDEIAAAVTRELQVTLLGEAPHATVVDAESYELALQGRFFFNRRNEGDLPKALEAFERAVDIDPSNAIAWTGLAPLYYWLNDPPDVKRSLAAAQRAVELEPENPEARMRYSMALYWSGKKDEGSEQFEQAAEMGQQNPLVLSIRAGRSCYEGDIDTCTRLQRRALELDPLHVTNRGNLARYLLYAGGFDESAAEALRLLEIIPDRPNAMMTLAEARLHQGRHAEARELIQKTELTPDPTDMDGLEQKDLLLAAIEFSVGDFEAADAAVREFRGKYGDRFKAKLAMLHAWRGESDEAFLYLERVLAENEALPNMVIHDPMLVSLHDDPRWAGITARWAEKAWIW
ncbi:MAG: tetratricopeptide repeat protein [Gammaproteobacteria bacterium]|nr:tetratricopeptide repeat protein [Gammaproteobacteria bacterium]